MARRRSRLRRPGRLIMAAATLLAVAMAALGQPSAAAVRGSVPAAHPRTAKPLGQLLTYGYDNARDGVDTADPSFAHLKPAWTRNLSGGIYGQPLVDGKLVIVATELDEVYALNASTGKVAWRFSIGRSTTTSVIDNAPGLSGCGDISPLGITGTPVIDPATGEL
ncbi:MAG: PQQ-binding-like beta-propeller repeat protein, partial [Acidimicrobiales bacterium]